MEALAVCTPGLEAILDAELAALGIRQRRLAKGGVSFRGSTRDLYKANVWLRTASRLLVRIGRFRATSFRDLEREASALDWSSWLGPSTQPRLRVSSGSSRLHHTGAIEERIAQVLGVDVRPDDPERGSEEPAQASDEHTSDEKASDEQQTFVVRVRRDVFTISADASGDSLHQRGWRQAVAKAPMRETLAAAMVLASEWAHDRPLLDPLCGSGTIAIEAALIAQGRAPGAQRSFALQRWPRFEPGTWASVQADVRAAEESAAGRQLPLIAAADRNRGAIQATLANAQRAGVADAITIEQASLAESISRHTSTKNGGDFGVVLTNPPYGARIGRGDLRDLYATLGRAAPWELGLLVADRSLAGHTKLNLAERFRTSNGGIPVTYLQSTDPPPRGRR